MAIGKVSTVTPWHALLVGSILFPAKTVNKKQYITMVIVEINGTVKDLKETGMVIPIPALFSCSRLACEEVRCTLENDCGRL